MVFWRKKESGIAAESTAPTTQLSLQRDRSYVPFALVGFVGLAGIAALLGQTTVCDLCIAEVFFIGSTVVQGTSRGANVSTSEDKLEEGAQPKEEEISNVKLKEETELELKGKSAESEQEETKSVVPQIAKQDDALLSGIEATLDSPPPYEESAASAVKNEDVTAAEVSIASGQEDAILIQEEEDGILSEAEVTVKPQDEPSFLPNPIPERVEYICSRPVTPNKAEITPTVTQQTPPIRIEAEISEIPPNPVPERVEYINKKPLRIDTSPPTPPVSPPREESAQTVAILPQEYFTRIDEATAVKDSDVSTLKIDEDWQDILMEASQIAVPDSPVESEHPSWNTSEKDTEQQKKLREQLREAFEEDMPEVMHVEDVTKESVVKELIPKEIEMKQTPVVHVKEDGEEPIVTPAVIPTSSDTLSPVQQRPALILLTQEQDVVKVLYDANNSRSSSFDVHHAIPPAETADEKVKKITAEEIIARMDKAREAPEIVFSDPFSSKAEAAEPEPENASGATIETAVKPIRGPVVPAEDETTDIAPVPPVVETKATPTVVVSTPEDVALPPSPVSPSSSTPFNDNIPEPSSPASTVSTMVEDKDVVAVKVNSQTPTIIEEDENGVKSISQTSTIHEEVDEDTFGEGKPLPKISGTSSSRASSISDKSAQNIDGASSGVDYTQGSTEIHRTPSGSRVKVWLRRRLSMKPKRSASTGPNSGRA